MEAQDVVDGQDFHERDAGGDQDAVYGVVLGRDAHNNNLHNIHQDDLDAHQNNIHQDHHHAEDFWIQSILVIDHDPPTTGDAGPGGVGEESLDETCGRGGDWWDLY